MLNRRKTIIPYSYNTVAAAEASHLPSCWTCSRSCLFVQISAADNQINTTRTFGSSHIYFSPNYSVLFVRHLYLLFSPCFACYRIINFKKGIICTRLHFKAIKLLHEDLILTFSSHVISRFVI